MSGASSRRWLRWTRRLVVLAAIGASTAVVAVSIVQLQDTRDDTEAADRATRIARRESRERQAALDDLLESTSDARLRTERDTTDASSIDDSVVLLQQMRTDMGTAQKATEVAEAGRRDRQARIDLLDRCRATLGQAATDLATAQVGASTLGLELGRTECQEALEVVQGDSGAVHPYDFADPHVIVHDGTSYAFGTNGPAGTVQVIRSRDLGAWAVLPPALPSVAAWAQPGWTWAPAVARVGDRFVLYYTVRAKDSGKQCISSATSIAPQGPYVDDSLGPLVCQTELGGSIDPSPYRDEIGFLHLTWKSEDETVGGRAQLWTQLLSSDGRTLFGPATPLLQAERDWERKTIENPSMTKIGDRWVLLYSANRWNTSDYALAYATCASAIGPCERPERTIIRTSSGREQGPGGGQFFLDGGGRLMVAYAAWDAGQVGYPNSRRLHVVPATMAANGLTLG